MKKSILLFLSLFVVLIVNAEGFEIGDKATDFKLLNVDGSYVSMSDYEDAKGFVIIFTCNHCPYAKAYEDRIIALDKKYKDLGYPVIAINPNDPEVQHQDSYELMKVRAKEKNFNFPYLFDMGQKVYPQYGATRTPHVFLLKKESADLIVKYIGAIDDNYTDEKEVEEHYLSDAIDALLNGENIAHTMTKAIGCSIKVQKN